MPSCPSCRRPVAVARASCLYCGAPLAAEDVAAALSAAAQVLAQAQPPAGAAGPGRGLVILDLADANPETLAAAVGLPTYEAGLLARRGGLHLHRVLGAMEAQAEADRLGSRGVTALVVPEEEARVRPLRALSGRRTGAGLSLRTQEDGPLDLAVPDLLIVVTGPIVREHQTRFERRRVDRSRPDEGRRVHLHRVREAAPVEIDPDNFEAGLSASGSARLEIEAWVAALDRHVPRDDGFRRLPPALAPAEPEPAGPLTAASSLRAPRRAGAAGGEDEPLLLDNVAQFRFYSGWRAAVERRRAPAAERS
jgi:hypothetical protein